MGWVILSMSYCHHFAFKDDHFWPGGEYGWPVMTGSLAPSSGHHSKLFYFSGSFQFKVMTSPVTWSQTGRRVAEQTDLILVMIYGGNPVMIENYPI